MLRSLVGSEMCIRDSSHSHTVAQLHIRTLTRSHTRTLTHSQRHTLPHSCTHTRTLSRSQKTLFGVHAPVSKIGLMRKPICFGIVRTEKLFWRRAAKRHFGAKRTRFSWGSWRRHGRCGHPKSDAPSAADERSAGPALFRRDHGRRRAGAARRRGDQRCHEGGPHIPAAL